MLHYLYYRWKYASYVHNEDGIKKFAERAMGKLSRKVTKKSAFYREMSENLMVEKANLRLRLDELDEKPMLEAGEYFRVRRRIWINTLLVAIALLGAVFLNVLAISAFISGETVASGFLRWFISAVLALVLTGGGLVVAERLIEALMGRAQHRRSEADESVTQTKRTGRAILWGTLLVAIEVAIVGVAEVRATMLEGDGANSLLYIGFVTLLMVLPLIAGAVHWDSMRHFQLYKTTLSQRRMESRLAQIDSILRQNEEYESNFYKIKSLHYWEQVNTFKTYKENYDRKKERHEPLSEHYAHTFDTFQREANKRYEADIRDITSSSMRRLESATMSVAQESSEGSKLENTRQPMPSGSQDNGTAPSPDSTTSSKASDEGERDAAERKEDDDLVAEAKPIR